MCPAFQAWKSFSKRCLTNENHLFWVEAITNSVWKQFNVWKTGIQNSIATQNRSRLSQKYYSTQHSPSQFPNYPLNLWSVWRQPGTERSGRVLLLIEPSDFLPQHRLERHSPHADSQILTGDGKHERLKKRFVGNYVEINIRVTVLHSLNWLSTS